MDARNRAHPCTLVSNHAPLLTKLAKGHVRRPVSTSGSNASVPLSDPLLKGPDFCQRLTGLRLFKSFLEGWALGPHNKFPAKTRIDIAISAAWPLITVIRTQLTELDTGRAGALADTLSAQ